MNEKQTELVLILDKSGSMGGLEADTIGGYNAMLKKQKEEGAAVSVTTLLFDHRVEFVHDRLPIACVKPLTDKEYRVGGMTALLDAVGIAIEHINSIEQAKPACLRAGKVIFVITTDGFENASKKFTYAKLKELIETMKKEFSWEFIFLGANMDAVSEAEKLGIEEDRAATFINDSEGIATNYESVTKAVSAMRSSPSVRMDRSWKAKIDADFKKRGTKKK